MTLFRAMLLPLVSSAVGILDARIEAQISAPPSAAGYGAVYRTVDVQAATGNSRIQAAIYLAGSYFLSGTRTDDKGAHLIYRLDPDGGLLVRFPQPEPQQASRTGITDLTTDGRVLIGGSDVGISAFDTSGNPVDSVMADLGLQTVPPLIAGGGLASIGSYCAVGFDPEGDDGRGSIWTGCGYNVLEIDLAGEPLSPVVTLPAGAAVSGMTRPDPCGGMVWLSADGLGRIVEFDPEQRVLTGNSIPRPTPASPSKGLSGIAWGDGTMLWSMGFGVVGISDSGPPVMSLHRIHSVSPEPPPDPPLGLPPCGVLGYDEVFLEVGFEGGPMNREPVRFHPGGVLRLRVNPNGEAEQSGQPVILGCNLEPESSMIGCTLLPEGGVFPELDLLNHMSIPASSAIFTADRLGMVPLAVGEAVSILVPDSLIAPSGYKLKFQAAYVSSTRGPAATRGWVATNAVYCVR